MPGWIDVVYAPNPLLPASDRKVRRIVLAGADTVDSIVRRMGLQATPLAVALNGVDVPKKRRHKKAVRAGDHLVLLQTAQGVESFVTASAAMSGKTIATAELLGTIAGFATNLAISLALNFAANALFGQQRNIGNARKDPDGYSISGGANQARQYGPLALVLGEHRVFPDYASQPFTEFVLDPTATRDIINGTPQTEARTPPEFGFLPPPAPPYTPVAPWTRISGNPPESFGYYGDNAQRSYTKTSGPVEAPHTFIIRYAEGGSIQYTTWEMYTADSEFSPAEWVADGPLPVIIRYGYTLLTNTERLTSIFHFGFGDLVISDLRIGSTAIDEYVNWERHDSTVPAGQLDRTQLLGYSCPGWIGDAYPTHVQIEDGGKLEQHDGIPADGWVTRQAQPGCDYIQFDLSGRLFAQSGEGITNLDCVFESQYREVGTESWVDFPFSPMTLTSGVTTPKRETFRHYMPAPARYEVRVRRLTADESDANRVSEFSLTQIKFFITDPTKYPAQRRLGLLVQATGQLNGRLDRLSALVKAKHWAWVSASPWTPGAFPGVAGAWQWIHTVNPAWLFLFYARGGYLNASATPAHLGGGAGWLDQPDPANGVRLFGAGLPNDRIDYAAIVAWGQFCAVEGLECRMAIDSQRPVAEVLDDIAAAGRASKTWAPGKLSVVWEAPDQPAVAVFGMPNIVAGSFQIAYDGDDTVDEFVLDFTDPDDDFSAATVRAVVPGVLQPVNAKSVRASYAMPRAQAQREVNLMAAARFYHRRKIQWEAQIEGYLVRRGDVVMLAHDLTQWAHSGRLIGLSAENGLITSAALSCEVDVPPSGTIYLWLRRPDGSFASIKCASPVGRSSTLQVLTAWQVSDAPGDLGQAEVNEASNWPDSVPEDWIFMAGPTPTPGKRVRIESIDPADQFRLRITARDEVVEYYPMQYAGAPAVDGASGQRLVARATRLGLTPAAGGGHLLSWQLENAHGADVSVSVNGTEQEQVPVRGYLSVSGEELLLPAYPAGTHLDIAVLPISAGAPVAIEGDRIAVTI